jgi:hypothetical protein
VAQQIVGLPGTAELMRDLAGNLNTNIDRLVPTREDVQKQQEAQAQQQAAAAEHEMQMRHAEMGLPNNLEPNNLQEDGTEMGGRQNNYMSPRPNGM